MPADAWGYCAGKETVGGLVGPRSSGPMRRWRMNRLEGLGFLCLGGCTVAIALSQPVVGAILGILAGGLFAASVRPRPMGSPATPPRDDEGP